MSRGCRLLSPRLFFLVSALFLSLECILGQNVGLDFGSGVGPASNVCTTRSKCGECLQGPNCVWCKDPRFLVEDSGYTRCNTRAGHRALGKCSEQHLVALPLPTATADGTGDGDGSGGQRQSTIQPATYKIKLGVGQRINITLDYTDPGNKPLDLYYLMDLSHTMEKHKESVQKLGRELASALRKTTSELQIGFGSFIDKPIMPYATLSDITPRPNENSVPTYGFRNHLKLTKDVAEFEKVVREARISRNLDAPEGGLDAIMQAIECQEEIGWRNDSHHVLVMSTDGSFHIAGDGKLAGIVIPHDGRCHMANHYYSKSTELDYPSIWQVIGKIRERKTHTIFAVTEEQVALYQELSQLVPDYATTEKFDSTSSNAKEIISNQYKSIRETVQLSADKQPVLQLRYFAKCNPNDEYEADKRECHGVGPQSTLKFIVQLELLSCPPHARQWKSFIDISPTSSTFNEKLRVHYDLQCGCGCEEADDPLEVTATGGALDGLDKVCTNPTQGTVRCGICHCKEGAYIGERCQCPIAGAGNETNFQSYLTDEKCREKADSSLVCSGRGRCECGQCVTCIPGWSGKFCQCESSRCLPQGSSNSRPGPGSEPELGPASTLACSGPDRGSCACDRCVCKDQYNGDHCECEKSTRNCVRAGGQQCSGHGNCKCNKCACEPPLAWGGKYCELCISPTNDACACPTDINDYISCVVQDKEIEPTPEHNVTEYKLVLKEDHQTECGHKNLQFEVLEPIYFVGENEFNQPGAGLDENARMKKCTTKLKSEYRPNCVIEYVYAIATPVSALAPDFLPYKEALKIYIRESPTCSLPPAQQDPLYIVLGTSGGVVLIGLLTLLLWKILTYFHDKREYTRFEKERKGAKWDASGNPLYSEPISTFQNPAYRE